MDKEEKTGDNSNEAVIKIGSKHIENYVTAVVMAFNEKEIVNLRAVGNSINIMERVIKLMSIFKGIKELERHKEYDGDIEVLVCRVTRNG